MIWLHYWSVVGTVFGMEVFTCQAGWAWWRSRGR